MTQEIRFDIPSHNSSRSHSFTIIPRIISEFNLARNKVVATGTSVGNHTSQLITSVEDNTVRAGRTPIVHIAIAQDRKFVVGPSDGEVKALVVVVDMWVAIFGGTSLVQLIAGSLGAADGAAGVADRSASVGARTLVGSSDGGSDEEGGQSQNLDLLLGFDYGQTVWRKYVDDRTLEYCIFIETIDKPQDQPVDHKRRCQLI